MRLYIDAAVAAYRSDLQNRDVLMEDYLREARDAAARLELEVLSGDVRTDLGEVPDAPFRIRLSAAGQPQADVSLSVQYPALRSNGRIGVRYDEVRTNADGIAEWFHPAPGFVGREDVVFGLDMNESLDAFLGLSTGMDDLISALTDEILDVRVRTTLEVVSRAREIPTAIVVLDTDVAGNQTSHFVTSEGIAEALRDAGFNIQSVSFNASDLSGLGEAEILSALRAELLGEAQRVVVGVASIDEFEERDGYVVRVSGSVQILDLENGRVLARESAFLLSRGTNPRSTISAAFRNLGVRLGDQIARSLP